MNGRILHLLQQPQQIHPEDLQLLSREIQRYPYAQSLRALHLLGTSKFAPADYQNELSTAAAYTTDKKVLYHLVHGRKFQEKTDFEQITPKNSDENLAETSSETQSEAPLEIVEEKQNAVEPESAVEIISESEEIIENQNIKPENDSLISAKIQEEKSEKPQEAFYLNETSEKKPQPDAEVNFYQTAETQSAVVPAPEIQEKFVPPTENSADKVEQARLDLIAEVERKMAEKRRNAEGSLPVQTSEKEEQNSHQINFSPEEVEDVSIEDKSPENQILTIETPQNLSSEEIPGNSNIISEDLTEENSSQTADFKEIPAENPEKFNTNQTAEQSNVPGFFSTWMSWLNLDRAAPEPKPEPKKIDNEKLNVIDKFIAAEPKITPVRGEDNSGKSNDRKDNIMHLMTDTLANLYVEQRLYGKALQAYEYLGQKHPEKQEYYAEKMAKIQEMRTPGGN